MKKDIATAFDFRSKQNIFSIYNRYFLKNKSIYYETLDLAPLTFPHGGVKKKEKKNTRKLSISFTATSNEELENLNGEVAYQTFRKTRISLVSTRATNTFTRKTRSLSHRRVCSLRFFDTWT